ncbi:MAG: tetratricopeptide repeat protein [Planctomycetes bacterium]|nr:tetratricopeptide repeat protein [Planctomycetota bacterium]
MKRLALAGFVCLAFSSVAAAETVTILRKDGQEITGELLEYTPDRVYRVRAGEVIWQVPESSVRSMRSALERSSPLPPAGAVAGAAAGPGYATPRLTARGRETVPWDLDFNLYVQTEVLQARRTFEEGLAHEKAGSFPLAREAYRRARETDPWFLAARLAYAHASIRIGDWPAATGELEAILATDPKNELGHQLNVMLFEKRGDPEGANAAWRRMITARYPSPEAHYRCAHLYLSEGDLERARVYWQRYLELDPRRGGAFDEEAVLERLAEEAREAGNFDTALTHLYGALRANPLTRGEVLSAIVRVHEGQANALIARGDWTGALDAISRLTEMDPTTAAERHETMLRIHTLSMAYASIHGPRLALEEALVRAERDMSADEYLGVIGRTTDRILESATEDPSRPTLGPALALLAEVLLRNEMPREREVEVRRKLCVAFASLADGAYRAKDFETAADNIQAAARVLPAEAPKFSPRLVEYSLAKARALAARRDYAGAMAVVAHMQEVAPDSAAVRQGADDVEFILLKVGLAAEINPYTKEEMLRTFLGRARPEEYLIFAKGMLADVAGEIDQASRRLFQEMRRYYPLAPGSEWVYTQGDTRVVHRVGPCTYDRGQEVYEIVQESMQGGTTHGRKVQVVEDKASITLVDRGLRDQLFQFPVLVGKSWEWTEGKLIHRRTYVSTGETVVTRAARYQNCLKVEFKTLLAGDTAERPTSATTHHYYAPGVGLVRVEVEGDTEKQLELELVSYKKAQE